MCRHSYRIIITKSSTKLLGNLSFSADFSQSSTKDLYPNSVYYDLLKIAAISQRATKAFMTEQVSRAYIVCSESNIRKILIEEFLEFLGKTNYKLHEKLKNIE